MDSPQPCLPNSSQHSHEFSWDVRGLGAGSKTSSTIGACNYHQLRAHGSVQLTQQRTQQCSVFSLLEDTLLVLHGLIPDFSLFSTSSFLLHLLFLSPYTSPFHGLCNSTKRENLHCKSLVDLKESEH